MCHQRDTTDRSAAIVRDPRLSGSPGSSVQLAVGYATDNRKWTGGQCRLNIDGPAWPAAWQSEAKAAMAAWNGVSPSTFAFVSDPVSSSHLAAYDNGRWNGWLAMTWTTPKPQGSWLSVAKIVVNTHYEWTPAHPFDAPTSAAGAYDLETALTHELGHALHLHEDTSGAPTMMAPTLKPATTRVLHADDRRGLLHLYP